MGAWAVCAAHRAVVAPSAESYQLAGDLVGTGPASIAIDGKTLRGSLDRFADVAPLQWLSAFATGQRLVLGQVALADGDKGGEIAAAQRLIEELGLTGKLLTLDALHAQKNTASRRA